MGAYSRYVVNGVCCATEEMTLKKHLDRRIGADKYRFNRVTCELRVLENVDVQRVVDGVRDAGFEAKAPEQQLKEPFIQQHGQTVTTIGAALLGSAGALLAGQTTPSIGKILLAAAILVGGWKVFRKAFLAVSHLVLDMNVLMSVAMIGALCIGRWVEGAAVIVLFSVSLVLENYSRARTRRGVARLMDFHPQDAVVIRGGRELTAPASSLLREDVILIRPGARIPVDGLIIDGVSTVSESLLTGESTPVERGPGMEVFAGCMNYEGALTVKVLREFEETRLAHILHLVEEARSHRAPLQNSIDRFAGIYTWIVLATAIAVAAVPPLFFMQPLQEWFYRALVLVVIACPCALVISTPVTLISALTAAARSGILIKGGAHIETLSQLRSIALDKTGTLTPGRPRVTDVVSFNGMKDEKLLEIMGAMERKSGHHIASGVLREAAEREIDIDNVRVDHFKSIPGQGIAAVIGGKEFFFGKMGDIGKETNELTANMTRLRRLKQDGHTVMVLRCGEEEIGAIALRDVARDEDRGVVEELGAMGIEHMVVLSGDTKESVDRLRREIGMEHGVGELAPEQKAEAVRELQRRYGPTAMVGDGVNDAPALAAASVGIAVGAGGADLALETADIVLMGADLQSLPMLIRSSRRVLAIVKQNMALTVGLKLLFLVLSIAGWSTIWLALLADDGASFLAIMNGLRALKRH